MPVYCFLLSRPPLTRRRADERSDDDQGAVEAGTYWSIGMSSWRWMAIDSSQFKISRPAKPRNAVKRKKAISIVLLLHNPFECSTFR
jgi:hypothetical protein